MKQRKWYMLLFLVICLSLVLSACSGSSKNEGKITMSDVLNGKKMVPVVVTDEKDETEDDHVVWAGYIGKGKIKAMHLDGMMYGFGYKDLKKLDDEKFDQSLVDMGKDYEPTQSKYVTARGKNVLMTNWYSKDNDDNKAEAVNLKFMRKGDDPSFAGVKSAINNAVFTHIEEKDEDDAWATITSGIEEGDTSGYEMHIKLGKGKDFNLKMEDADKAKEKYDNVEIDDEVY